MFLQPDKPQGLALVGGMICAATSVRSSRVRSRKLSLDDDDQLACAYALALQADGSSANVTVDKSSCQLRIVRRRTVGHTEDTERWLTW